MLRERSDQANVGPSYCLTNSFSLHLIQSDTVRETQYGISSSSSQIIYLKIDTTIVHSLYLVLVGKFTLSYDINKWLAEKSPEIYYFVLCGYTKPI